MTDVAAWCHDLAPDRPVGTIDHQPVGPATGSSIIDHASTPGPTDEFGRPRTCPRCGSVFPSFKQMKVHEASHRIEVCRYCGSSFALRGLARHEQTCRRRKNRLAATTAQRLTAAVDNFTSRAYEVPPDAYLVVADNFGPAFTTGARARQLIGEAGGAMLVIPSRDIEPLTGAAIRDRRIEDDRCPTPGSVREEAILAEIEQLDRLPASGSGRDELRHAIRAADIIASGLEAAEKRWGRRPMNAVVAHFVPGGRWHGWPVEDLAQRAAELEAQLIASALDARVDPYEFGA